MTRDYLNSALSNLRDAEESADKEDNLGTRLMIQPIRDDVENLIERLDGLERNDE